MKKYQLGEFEEVVLLTIAILYKEAYGVAIRDEIQSRLSRKVSMGAMHSALVRMEDKGYVRSLAGEERAERQGRPRRYYELTALGKKALGYAKETRNELWRAIPKVVLQASYVRL